jgi:hypothetical protein
MDTSDECIIEAGRLIRKFQEENIYLFLYLSITIEQVCYSKNLIH